MKCIFSFFVFLIYISVFSAKSEKVISIRGELCRVKTVKEYILTVKPQYPLKFPMLLPNGNWGINTDLQKTKFFEIEKEIKKAENEFKNALMLYESGTKSLTFVCTAKEYLIYTILKKLDLLNAITTNEEFFELRKILQQELFYTYKQQLIILKNDYNAGIIGKDVVGRCEYKLEIQKKIVDKYSENK